MSIATDQEIGLNPIPRTEFVDGFVSHINAIDQVEWLPLEQCGGRVLAEDMTSRYALPSGRTFGGDAVVMKYSAFANGNPTPEQTAAWVKGVDWAFADMGDDVPDEFDCGIRTESVEVLEGGGIRLLGDDPKVSGPESFTEPGSKMQVGDPLASAGTVLTATVLAHLASAGHTVVPVRRKVRVAFIPTGSELVTAGEVLQRGKIPDSNSYMIRQLILDAGCEPIMFPIVTDTKAALADALERARTVADLVLINGGSSKGSEDFNAVLLQRNATYYQHGVKLRPARVAAASVIDGIPHVNLPGPTMAAMVVWQWLVRFAIAKLQGLPTPVRPQALAEIAVEPSGGPKMKPEPKKDAKDGAKDPADAPKPLPDEFMSFYQVKWEDGKLMAYPGRGGHGTPSAFNAIRIAERMGALNKGDQIMVELL
ncbi:MAG: molybdopterin-binding protein [Coriobacteriia bacterium]|nr:molybdopterin-binding protein [Coriobacteriia bacterium]